MVLSFTNAVPGKDRDPGVQRIIKEPSIGGGPDLV
jgi:hypothetical protein